VHRALVPACALLLALAGCGGGGGGQSASTQAKAPAKSPGKEAASKPAAPPSGQSAATAPAPGPPAAAFHPRPHQDSGGGSAQLIAPGGDNSVPEFGQEARGAEFKAAARALHNLLDARAERNWAAACRYLSKATKAGLAQLGSRVPQLKGTGCPTQLGAVTGTIAKAKLREAAIANLISARIQGDRAFLIYRGAHGQVEAVAALREGGAWKVASLGAVPLG
jgi:hypothetical protein